MNCELISGEKLQQICDVYCGSEYDLNRNPIIASQKDKHILIDTVNTEWNNPKLIFCYSCALSTLMNKLHLFKNNFVLVSHNEDNNITTNYLNIANSPLVIKWFAQNIMMNHPKVHLLPIGIANTMWPHGNINNFTLVKNFNKEDKIYFYFNTHTNSIERELCKNIIQNKGIHFGNFQSHENYLADLSKCKFAICPPGNGIDCHRTWECYYMNVIPILLRSTFTENLNNILPCILLNTWDEFNYNEIIDKYDELVKVLQRNKQYIDFKYYKELILSYRSTNESTLSITNSKYVMYDENQLNQLYLDKVKLPFSYFKKYETLPSCPVKCYNYNWGHYDFPRTWCILDFIEWTQKYKINVEHLGYTSDSDPELEFIIPSKKTLVLYPNYDLHDISNHFKNEFDFFLFNQTIEHLYNPFEAIKQIYEIVKYGGYVFTSVPTLNIPHMTPIHFNGYTPMGLAMLFKLANFEIIEIGQWGNFDYIQKLWREHSWPGYDKLNSNNVVTNEEENVCQCWILARKL